MADQPIRIVLAEDQLMLRTAIARLLALEDDLEVVGQTGRGDEVENLVSAMHPDVAVLDIEMPGMDGITVAARLHESHPDVRCMILTTFARPGYLLSALQAGVDGVLLKDASIGELPTAIRRVVRGEQVIDSSLALTALLEGSSPLTDREREVLAAARTYASINELAEQLMLSPGTVRNYLSRAMQKLHARNRSEAVEIATSKGWL